MAEESAAKKRKEQAKAKLLGHLGDADHALLQDRVLFSYDETAREWCDTKRLAEHWPDAYADCVQDRVSRRLNIPARVREEYTA